MKKVTCPICKQEVTLNKYSSIITCKICGTKYPEYLGRRY